MNISQFTHTPNLIQAMMSLDNSKDLPVHVYWKDLEGRYLKCNESQACFVGFSKKEDLIGLTDLDIKVVRKECLENFQNNDKKVVTVNQTKVFVEPLNLTNNLKYFAISQKIPLIAHKNEIIGSMGCSLIIPKNDIPENLEDILTYSDPCNYNLTKREIEIIQKLIRGYSAKKTGQLLEISPRTVEQHIENIKLKLGVNKKQEIIDRMIHLLSA